MMKIKTKNALNWGLGLSALACVIALSMYLYKCMPSKKKDPKDPIFSDKNIKGLERYLALGHGLSFTCGDSTGVPSYLPIISGAGKRVIAFAEMTASERLLHVCLRPDKYTSKEHIELICYRLYYLGLFHYLIIRYGLYIRIEFDSSGGFEIKNSLNEPVYTTNPVDEYGLKHSQYEELHQAIELMECCRDMISKDLPLQDHTDYDIEVINNSISCLNNFTRKAVSFERAKRKETHDDITTSYSAPLDLSAMQINNTIAQQLQDGNITQLEAIIEPIRRNQYSKLYVLRDFECGQREIIAEGDLLASQSTQNDQLKDRPESEAGYASSAKSGGEEKKPDADDMGCGFSD